MMKLGRLLKHVFVTPGALHRAFPKSTLERIKETIAETETHHSGEIRFAMEAALPWSYLRRNAPARQRALMVFSKLRVWDTEQNNGVLLYVELADRSVEIVADRGIAHKVGTEDWAAICRAMREHFRRGEYDSGALAGIQAIGARLEQHFPLAPGMENPNELPDGAVEL
jgi:uncharacterized membrane protein